MEKSELVVEFGVEEIPASMLEDAARQLAEFLVESLKAQRLPVGEAERLYTPRRIIAAIRDIPVCQDDLVESIVGPPKSVAYDAAGVPTRAALAFAQKNGVHASTAQNRSNSKRRISFHRAQSSWRENPQNPRNACCRPLSGKSSFPKPCTGVPTIFGLFGRSAGL